MSPPACRSWTELLKGRDIPRVALCRVDSPGESVEVRQGLLELGGAQPEIVEAAKDRGRIVGSKPFYDGLIRLFETFGNGSPLTTSAIDLTVLFDKHLTQQKLSAANVPIPEPVGIFGSFDEFDALVGRAGTPRVFIKPRHGSSGSGVLAYESSGDRRQVTAAIHLEMDTIPRLYNSLRVRRFRSLREIRTIIDSLAVDGMVVEQWVPKAGIDGRCFDLRVVVIVGKARHVVARAAHGPLTNLHLGNRRGDISAIRRRLGEMGWHKAMAVCEMAAAQFPETICVGVDLLVATDMSFRVAEVNAFGDLLPGVYHNGQDTYDAQVKAYCSLFPSLQVSTSGR
jgi:hypothetical protein